MKVSDYIMIGVFGGFGLWWVIFPQSVVQFYTWFHRGAVKMPRSLFGVRLAGVLWLALLATVSYLVFVRVH
jgi:hypothetical protein